MKTINKIFIFVMILLVGLTVVSATDIIDDDTIAIEAPQVEQTIDTNNNIVQDVQQDDTNEEESTCPLQTPRVISSNLVINDDNYACYNNVNWTVEEGVTVDGSNYQLNNVAINVVGDYVTLKNLNIATNNITKLIDATGTSNLTIADSTLTLTNLGTNGNNQAIGIDLTNAANASITGTTLQVNAPSQGQSWEQDENENWFSTLKVSAILVNNAENITINQNTIRIVNTTEKYSYTTMPAVTIKNGTKNINVTFNTIYATGAQFVYGIMMNDGVENAALKNNTVTVQDVLYVAGIDASTAVDSVVSGNQIIATSSGQSTYDSVVGEESLAYGIISDTYATGNQNNRICKNTIIITANTVYGIEVYKGNNITVCSNNIYGNGNKTMGVAFAHTNNSKIINNVMILTGTTTAHHPFYEEVTPVNAGIIFTNQSNGNIIQGNTILITATEDSNVYTINLQNSTTATITGNCLNVNDNEDNPVIIQDSLCSGMNIGSNTEVVLYPCNCGCMDTTTLHESSSDEAIFFCKTKNVKKDSENERNILIIDDTNYKEYGNYNPPAYLPPGWNYTTPYNINKDKIPDNTDVILKVNFELVCFSNYKPRNLNLIASYYNGTQVITGLGDVTNCYAPNSTLTPLNDTKIINSTFSGYSCGRYGNVVIINNTIIRNFNSNSTFYIPYSTTNNITVKNNYMVDLVEIKFGYTSIKLGYNSTIKDDYIIENNTPIYDTAILLNNSNYDTYFDDNNILKSEYAENVLFATENITNPVIINNKVTLSALRGYGGYSDVSFNEGSDSSVIEDSIIHKITLNGANNININNNKLLSNDSIIEVINSVENIIENNTINTKNTNTITFDSDSFGSTVRYNELTTLKYTGDKSVLTTDENTVEENTPEYIPTPELKVDTTEFTIGEKTTIKASIYLDEEIGSNITGGKVVFKVNGVTLKDTNGKVIYKKLENGTATIEDYEIPISWNKEGLTITAVYSGSSKCEALRSTAQEITITTPEPTITTDNTTTATIGSTIELKAKVSAGTDPITTGKVVFKVNGKTVKDSNGKVIYAKVDQNGEVSVNYTIPENMKAKDYTITITYTSTKYPKLTTNTTLTVTKT